MEWIKTGDKGELDHVDICGVGELREVREEGGRGQ